MQSYDFLSYKVEFSVLVWFFFFFSLRCKEFLAMIFIEFFADDLVIVTSNKESNYINVLKCV